MKAWLTLALQHTLMAVDKTLRDVCDEPEHPFGGKVVCFCGDFRQCLSIVPVRASAKKHVI